MACPTHASALERISTWLGRAKRNRDVALPPLRNHDIDVGAGDAEAVRRVVALDPQLDLLAGLDDDLRGGEREAFCTDANDPWRLRFSVGASHDQRNDRERCGESHQNHHPMPTLKLLRAVITELRLRCQV